MLLAQLQAMLTRINDAPVAQDVCDFLITDRAVLGRFATTGLSPTTVETLLVREDGSGLDLGLFLDPALLCRLAASQPLRQLDDDNLEDFCIALEGVSHFHCVAWSAARDCSVSVLGLEMQAEIDKYVLAVLIAGSQRGGVLVRGLYGRLFEQIRFRDDLDVELGAMYAEANRYAARFCRRLEDRFLRRREARVPEMLGELRRFYRLGDAAKLRLIEAA